MQGPSSKSSSCHIRLGLLPGVATSVLVDAAPNDAGTADSTPRVGRGGVPEGLPRPAEALLRESPCVMRGGAVEEAEEAGDIAARTGERSTEGQRGDVSDTSASHKPSVGNSPGLRKGRMPEGGLPEEAAEAGDTSETSGLRKGGMAESGCPQEVTEAGDTSETSAPHRLPVGNPSGLCKGGMPEAAEASSLRRHVGNSHGQPKVTDASSLRR